MNGFSNGCIVRKILAVLLLILNFHHFQLLNSRSKQKGKPPFFFFCIILVESISVMWGYDSPHFLTRFILKELEEKLWVNIIFGSILSLVVLFVATWESVRDPLNLTGWNQTLPAG